MSITSQPISITRTKAIASIISSDVPGTSCPLIVYYTNGFETSFQALFQIFYPFLVIFFTVFLLIYVVSVFPLKVCYSLDRPHYVVLTFWGKVFLMSSLFSRVRLETFRAMKIVLGRSKATRATRSFYHSRRLIFLPFTSSICTNIKSYYDYYRYSNEVYSRYFLIMCGLWFLTTIEMYLVLY